MFIRYNCNDFPISWIAQCEDGRQPMLMFMELPSKRIYPEYYTVISHPIDMMTIEQKIREEQYRSEEEILNDFKVSVSGYGLELFAKTFLIPNI